MLAVLDFEATCFNDKRTFKQEIIEFPVVLIDAQTGNQIGEEFHFYLRPKFHPELSSFCTELTGITQVRLPVPHTSSSLFLESATCSAST